MADQKLKDLRVRWLKAAEVYYLGHGEDSGMSDAEWDHIGRTLYAARDQLPGCPVLNHPQYLGGSLYWVRKDMFAEAYKADVTGHCD